MTDKKRGNSGVNSGIGLAVMWLDFVLALFSYRSTVSHYYYLALVVAKVACFGNDGAIGTGQILDYMWCKWTNGAYTCICTPAGLFETPILRQLHFQGNSFRNMQPCLSPNNLFYRVLRCQSVKFSSSIPSPKLMKAQYPFNPFPAIALIRQNHCDKFRWRASSQRKDMIEKFYCGRRRGGAPAWLMHHRWTITPTKISKLRSKTKIYPCPYCEAMIGDSHPYGEGMSKNNLSNFSSNILVYWGSSRLLWANP